MRNMRKNMLTLVAMGAAMLAGISAHRLAAQGTGGNARAASSTGAGGCLDAQCIGGDLKCATLTDGTLCWTGGAKLQ